MAEIPQIKEEHPLLNAQGVSSEASGHEAFAKLLGSISEKALEGSRKIADDASNTMYLDNIARIDEVKTTTAEKILTDPANASKHVEAMKYTVNTILDTSAVNDGDRSKLKNHAAQSYNAMRLDATRANIHQTQIGAGFEFYKSFPALLNDLRSAAIAGDEAQVKEKQDAMLEQIESLMRSKVITPHQGSVAIQTITDTMKMAEGFHKLFDADEEHQTPQNYHEVAANPWEDNKNNLNYPMDEHARWLVNHHATDLTFQGMQQGLYEHVRPDMEAYFNLTDHQRQQIGLEYQGIRRGDALIDSNASLPKIKNRIETLKGKSDYASEAESKILKNYVRDAENGDSQRIMNRTTLGGQIVKDYNDRNSYLHNKLRMTNPDNLSEINSIKLEIAKNKNDYVSKNIAYAEAHHLPIVNPIPFEDVQAVTNGFTLGANTQESLAVFNQYNKMNQLYFAAQMKKPLQKVIMSTISLVDKNATDTEKAEFMAANQPGRYKDLPREEGVKQNYLNTQFAAQLKDATKIITLQYGTTNALILNEQLIKSGVNYAKFLSEKNQQYVLQEDKSYFGDVHNVSDAVRFINDAYKPLSGVNYIVNGKQVGLDKRQMDDVAEYAIHQGEQFLRGHLKGHEVESVKNMTPLSVTVTPQNIVIAQTLEGRVVYRAPLNSNLVAKAQQDVKALRKERKQEKYKVFQPIEKKRTIHTGVEETLQTSVGEEENAE